MTMEKSPKESNSLMSKYLGKDLGKFSSILKRFFSSAVICQQLKYSR
jgi:hypothetical protein